MSKQLQFEQQTDEVALVGDLDRDSVPKAWAERQNWLPQKDIVILDLARVAHVDSAGLAFLIRLRSQLVENKQSLSLRNLNEQLQQFARVSGVEGLLSLS